MNAPAPILPASTIMLLRDGRAGLEVFMVVRHHQIDFASGALVFPGGKVDPGDDAPALRARLTGALPGREAFQIAAIREAFEECGVLLARPTGSRDLIPGTRLQDMEDTRLAIQAGERPFLDFVEAQDLQLAGDLLVPFAHWITPAMLPKRFDTHFYLALAPSDQLAVHDGHESVDSVWITPADACADAAAGRRTVIFPTLRNVEKLGTVESAAAAIDAARAGSVVTVLPWSEQRDDGNWLCIPPDAGYAISEERMPGRD